MKNLFRYDFANSTIIASKTALKKAGNPTTPEYKALMKMISGHPSFQVVEKTINTSKKKQTYNGLTLEVMRTHIEAQKDSVRLMTEFNEVQKGAKSKYPLAKKWFLEQFPGFKMTEGKKAVSNAKIAKAKANAKVILLKQTPGDAKNVMPAVVNQ